jgi:pimeloyl-ACP methyl ester carboxylesterase
VSKAFSEPTRRDLLATAAAAGASGAFSSAARAASESSGANGIRPFHIKVPVDALVDLRRRIAATRWPDRETVADDSQGVQLADMQEVVRYWGTEYDWRKCEAKLNALPQFITTIDGLDVHFIHVRSEHENALPLVVTHGWPGSVIEQLKIIGPLTDPTSHRASASDAFHLVIPSIPGFGFSAKPTATGWGPDRTARAWVTLMKRLGYTKFVAQGGDLGSGISEVMALQAPPELLGIHVNLPGTIPPDIAKALQAGDPPPADLSADERRSYGQLQTLFAKRRAYASMMATRPQTLYGLADSPVCLAAWMLDHGDGYGQPAAAIMSAVLGRTVNGHPADGLTRDDVLDDITLYWVTDTPVSAARFYWESKFNLYNAVNVLIPAAVSVFPGENYQAPRSWAERAYHKLIYFNEVEKGGHYAAWEQPQLFSEEVRAGFRSLR